MGTSEADEPGFSPALRPVVFRAYKITNEWFGKGKKVSELEAYLCKNDKRLFVERIRQKRVVKEVDPNLILHKNDEVVLSGRREFVIGAEDWIGPEVIDAQLLDFPAETLPVMVTHRTFAGETVSKIRAQKFMHGVSIRNIKRAGINVPVLPKTIVDSGDILELTGLKHEVESAAKQMGYIDGYDLRWIGYFARWSFRCTGYSSGRCSYQSFYQWRRIDSRTSVRLATQQASYFRRYPRTFFMGIE